MALQADFNLIGTDSCRPNMLGVCRIRARVMKFLPYMRVNIMKGASSLNSPLDKQGFVAKIKFMALE